MPIKYKRGKYNGYVGDSLTKISIKIRYNSIRILFVASRKNFTVLKKTIFQKNNCEIKVLMS